MLSWPIFILTLLSIAALFIGYPTFLWLYRNIRPTASASPSGTGTEELPTVSVLVAVRNGEHLIEAKALNCLQLDYPADKLDIVIVSDGSDDRTVDILTSMQSPRLTCLPIEQHLGKHEALNAGMPLCKGEIVIFTDADALLDTDAARQLVQHFRDPSVGGVGGQRLIGEKIGSIQSAQSTYIDADSKLKVLESQLGSVTSNDGKIYAIRKSLFQGVAAAVTDDLYVCLTIIAQGYRFHFEPLARAWIKTPSRNPAHEISRRRRIVNRSLRGIWLNRIVLNPGHTSGQIAVGLFINKVMRRLLPIFLIMLLITNMILATEVPWLTLLLLPQLGIYGSAALQWLVPDKSLPLGPLKKVLPICFYFVIGNLGTLLGVIDFMRGHQPIRWDPKKSG